MVMSILHRITGGALYFGTLLVAWWLIAAASSAATFDFVNGLFGSWIGRLVLFGYTWALIHHMLGGIRHLIWDTGAGLEKHTVLEARLGDARRLRRADAAGLDRRLHGAGRPDVRCMPTCARRSAKVRGLGSASEGTGHFWRQRLTAIANIPLILFFVGFLIALNGAGYAASARQPSPIRWSRWC